MTPNSNPSPELRAAVEKLTRPIIGMENRTPLEVRDILFDRIRSHFAALTPPTPAETVTVALPGAGERIRRAIWGYVNAQPEDAATLPVVQFLANRDVFLAEAIALATVAAANDEGVADDHGRVRQEAHVRGWKHGLEDAAKVADAEERKAGDEIASYDSYGGPPLPARGAEAQRQGAARSIAAAIRLLSQGGGK